MIRPGKGHRPAALLIPVVLAGFLVSCGASDEASAGYRLPWPGGQSHEVMQGPMVVDGMGSCLSGCGSHRDPDGQHSWDFDLPEGTPVLASRAGVVGLVVGSWRADHCGGLSPVADPQGYLANENMGNQANLVRIDHGDGTSALYLHLSSVDPAIEAKAKTGASLAQGELLGYSGRTGLTGCVPHLHFQVERTVRADWYTTSVPISFDDPDVLAQDPDGVPAEGGTYVSGNSTGTS